LKFEVLALLVTFGILFSIISNNSVYAQSTNTLGLKITSPTTDQQVPISNSLIVSGASSDNAISNCHVSVIVNSIKPYQPALASGHSGANDYSKWNFTLSPKYTAIKEGENKITAKLSCPTNTTNLTKWSSVNFVGIANTQQHVQLSSSPVAATPTKPTSTSSTVKPNNVTAPISPSNALPSSSVASSTTPTKPTSTSSTTPTKPTSTSSTTPTKPTSTSSTTENGRSLDNVKTSMVQPKAKSMDNSNKQLLVSIDISNNPVSQGNKQAILVTVSNADSDENVAGAKVIGYIFHPSGFVKKEFVDSTDDNGQVLYSWKIGKNTESSTYIVEAQVSALGYKDKLAKTMFKVGSVPTNNLDKEAPTQDNNNNGLTDNINNFAQHIIENVKGKIKSDGINIDIPLPIPFD
jgi:hypothetical protein